MTHIIQDIISGDYLVSDKGIHTPQQERNLLLLSDIPCTIQSHLLTFTQIKSMGKLSTKTLPTTYSCAWV